MLIRNKRTYQGPGVYVGRPSPLGNPFSHTHGNDGVSRVPTREDAIQAYRHWLYRQIQYQNPTVLAALDALTEDSILICWCEPLACHAHVIERAWRWLMTGNPEKPHA